MRAFTRKKQEWEFENQQVLFRLIRTSSDVSVESVKAAGRATSFLIYLVYVLGQGMLALSRLFWCKPGLIQRVSPELPPLEEHDFNAHQWQTPTSFNFLKR